MKLINKLKCWKIIQNLVSLHESIHFISIMLCLQIFVTLIIMLYFFNITSGLYFLLLPVPSFILAYLMSFVFSYVKNINNNINNKLKNKNIKKEDKEILINFIIEEKRYDIFFENIKDYDLDFQNEIFTNEKIYSIFLNRCNFSIEHNNLLYFQVEEILELYPKNILENIVYLLKRKNTDKIINIKKKLYSEYDKNKIKEESIEYILKSKISDIQKLYLISKKEINQILENMELIKSSFEDGELIILDIFNEMSIDKKLECFKNENFSIYIKKVYELNKHCDYNDSYYLRKIYDVYFKELCLLIKEKELTEYYQIISFVFNQCSENEIDSIKYRTNTTIELQKNIIEDKNLKVIKSDHEYR